jgi:hypothetical protein
MKYMFLAIFVLIASQPLQAAVCDTHDAQNTTHSQHGDMHDDNSEGMDCCGDDAADSGDGCGSMSHCGACPTGLVAVKPSLVNAIFNTDSQQYLMVANKPLYRFSAPPLRPPIS